MQELRFSSGRVRMLATSGGRRSRFHPGVDTFTEQGLRDIQVTEWFGFSMAADCQGYRLYRCSVSNRPDAPKSRSQ